MSANLIVPPEGPLSDLKSPELITARDISRLLDQYGSVIDFADLLPLSFPLDGKPMDVLNRRPMFAPVFQKTRQAKRRVFICGRQLGKTVSAAASMLMDLVWRMAFNVLYVSPLAIYTNRMHHIYMHPMIRGSTLPWPLQDRNCVNNVNEKTFTTGSHFHGVSCFNNAGQAIGIPRICRIVYDETQDLNLDFIPQIRETMGAAPDEYRWEDYFGTARGMEGTLQVLFEQSCQYEWHMRCGCSAFGEYVVPTLEKHALSMIQKDGICCPKCSRPIDVRRGEWVPAFQDRVQNFEGYHIPQTIVWDRINPHTRYIETIYNKLYGLEKYSTARFCQELLGISSDQGGRPVTSIEIRNASILPFSRTSPPKLNEYYCVGGGVDWGGSEVTSFTVATAVGWHVSGKFHVLGAIRPTGIPDNERHYPLASFLQKIAAPKINVIGADAGFVGSVQNKNLQKISGIKVASIAEGTSKNFFKGLSGGNNFIVDRTTLLFIVFSLIKDGLLLFPAGAEFETFTQDLLAVFVEELDTPVGVTVRRYARYETKADDFLHALGFALFVTAYTNPGLGIDLCRMVGLAPNTSLTKEFVDTIIGEE